MWRTCLILLGGFLLGYLTAALSEERAELRVIRELERMLPVDEP